MRLLLAAGMLALMVTPMAVAPANAAAVTKSEVAGLSPTVPALVLGAPGTAYDPAGDPPAWYAMADAYDSGTAQSPTRPVRAGYYTHYDADGHAESRLTSVNGGTTFTASTGDAHEAATRLDDGRVLSVGFAGQETPVGSPARPQLRDIKIFYSSDDGATYGAAVPAQINIAPQAFNNATANFYPNSLVQVPGGPVLMAGYAVTGSIFTSSMLLSSFDQGRTWALRATLGQGSTARGFTETGLVLASNGDLVAVMRTSTYDNLWVRRSTTAGTTWTGSAAPIAEFAADASGNRPFGRINPRLSLLPNGILALVAGRPDNFVALSYDGTGRTWDVKRSFYDNHSVAAPQNLNEGTSGNADLAWTEANRAVLMADSCHAITYEGAHYNKCTWHGATMSDGTTTYQVKRVLADILTAGSGKIDLRGKVAAGTVQLGGDYGTAIAGHPRTGNQGAVDGSNEMWSSAIRSGGAGVFDISLDRAYTLSKAGLSLAIGGIANATVQTRLTTDDAWSDWYSVTNQSGYALKYTTPATSRTARYVRVLVGESSICPPGVTAPCSQLNEIELYADDVNSFENDPVNGIPRGYSIDRTVDDAGVGHLGVWVSQTTSGSGSSRVLRIVDSSTVHLPAARRIDSTATTKTVGFRFHPDQWRTTGAAGSSALLFDILTSAGQAAFHFALTREGNVRYHDGTAWRALGTGQSFDPSASCTGGCVWTGVEVRATTTTATITVNGQTIGTATRFDGGTTALTGHQFAASSTPEAGENFLVDDVSTRNG
ncbi:sialidase family protein [Actinoplanes sp. NPDC051861]|uniref:sialidase family protein n=1 Tax=Actinoplanes sp. NPDC051861 TaxID=3155170 RepID=UPI0034289D85